MPGRQGRRDITTVGDVTCREGRRRRPTWLRLRAADERRDDGNRIAIDAGPEPGRWCTPNQGMAEGRRIGWTLQSDGQPPVDRTGVDGDRLRGRVGQDRSSLDPVAGDDVVRAENEVDLDRACRRPTSIDDRAAGDQGERHHPQGDHCMQPRPHHEEYDARSAALVRRRRARSTRGAIRRYQGRLVLFWSRTRCRQRS